MLQAIRRGIGSWIARILLGLIIIAFALFFGFGDFAGVRRDTTVIEVGDRDISATEFQQELRQVQARLGPEIDPQRALELGLVDMTVRGLVDRTLMDQAVARLGLAVSDQVIKQQIFDNPAFRNTFGEFDRQLFEQVLARVGMNEQMFVAASRQDTAREHLLSSVVGGSTVPRLLAETIYAYRGERRVAEVMVIPHASISGIGEPDEAALAEFHASHAHLFTAPEYRRVTYLTLAPQDLVAEIQVSDDEVREEYDVRLDEYVTLERRDVDQIVYDDEESARRAHEALKGGKDFAELAAETADLAADDIALGLVTADELPVEVAEAVFALVAGDVGGPLQSPFGWHVFRVNRIEPGGTRGLDEVREVLLREMKLERAADALFELANKVEDELAGGATLEETAARLNLKLGTLAAIDASGRDEAGAPAAELPAAGEFLAAAFEAETGIETALTETDEGGYFILRVDRVTPPELRPLESVREDVRSAWVADRRSEVARREAEAAAERLKGGADLKALGAELGYTVRTTEALTRDGLDGDPAVSPLLLARLFGLDQGEVASAASAADDAHVVARLNEVRAAEPAADREAVERLADALEDAVSGDLLTLYRAALEAEHGVSVDRRAIDTLFDLGPVRGF